jgi:dTMP kinase
MQLNPSSVAGRLITFEGPDGSGKTTQIKRLVADLEAQGYPVISGREPGGTAIGDEIRATLHALKHVQMDPRTEFLLYAASRAQIVAELLRPALAVGKIVLLDRFIDSTFAYQGYGRGLPMDDLQQITAFATGGLRPDLTLYFEISADAALARRQRAAAQGEELTRMDAQALDFHHRVRAGYDQLITADSARWARIDAAQPIEQVWAQVRGVVTGFLAGAAKASEPGE